MFNACFVRLLHSLNEQSRFVIFRLFSFFLCTVVLLLVVDCVDLSFVHSQYVHNISSFYGVHTCVLVLEKTMIRMSEKRKKKPKKLSRQRHYGVALHRDAYGNPFFRHQMLIFSKDPFRPF